MVKHRMSERARTIGSHLVWTVVSGLIFAASVSFATRRYTVSLVTGLAMAATIEAAYLLDHLLLEPRLRKLPYDWLRFGLEITFSLLGHVGGSLLALLVCSRLFGFSIWDTQAWWAVGGILIGFPVIHGTEMALRFLRQLREKEQQEEQLRTLTAEAELKALKAQINPHFLFNTLNTIAQLIHTDPERAETTVERLAEMFRYVLAGSERRLVPLGEELAFVDSYLEIERARFGRRLRVAREVAPEAAELPMPSLILQPLVENAVQHGQGTDGSIDICIHIAVQDKTVLISVADQGPGMPPNHSIGNSPGHGLRNVNERLQKIYGVGLEVGNNEPCGTIVTVRIPREQST